MIGIYAFFTYGYVYRINEKKHFKDKSGNSKMNFLICTTDIYIKVTVIIHQQRTVINKGNNKITELRTILQRESQNS